MDYSVLKNARTVYRQTLGDLFQRRHVVACGLGYKIRDGKQSTELSLVVSVTRKVPRSELAEADVIPQSVSGLTTDVVETGRLHAYMPENPRARHRPAPAGTSLGHRDITAGTFGLLVHREGRAYILSNNHVIADSNAARIGDPIYQPGPADGGTANDQIATLFEMQPLDFGDNPAECDIVEKLAALLNLLASWTGSTHRLQPVKRTPGLNSMDAALALPDQPSLVRPEIMGIGLPSGMAPPFLGQRVQKMGRTTGLTQGIVTQIDVTVNVDYAGRTARFRDQVFTGPMSSPGDSGSTILDMERRVVGQLFAGSERVTIFTPITPILDRFGVELVTSSQP